MHDSIGNQMCNAGSHLNALTEYLINCWPSTMAKIKKYNHIVYLEDMALIDDIVMKGKRIVVPASLQQ